MATLATELAIGDASHLPLVEVTTCSKVDANKAQTDIQNSQARIVEAEYEANLSWGDLDKVWELSAKSVKAAEKTLRQLTELPNQAQAVEVEIKSLKLQIDGVYKIRDDAISSATEKGLEAKMLESCIGVIEK